VHESYTSETPGVPGKKLSAIGGVPRKKTSAPASQERSESFRRCLFVKTRHAEKMKKKKASEKGQKKGKRQVPGRLWDKGKRRRDAGQATRSASKKHGRLQNFSPSPKVTEKEKQRGRPRVLTRGKKKAAPDWQQGEVPRKKGLLRKKKRHDGVGEPALLIERKKKHPGGRT